MDVNEYYKILGLPKNAGKDQVKKAYRRLAKKYHPDVNHSNDSQERFVQICEAYEFLKSYNPVFIPEAEIHPPSGEKYTTGSKQAERQAYEDYRKEAAKKRAQARFEKLKREKQQYKESGWYDVFLLLKYFFRFLSPFVALGLIALPVYVGLTESFQAFFVLFFFWTGGGFFVYYIIQNRKSFFKPGTFYYSFRDVLSLLFNNTTQNTNSCYYCKGKKANALPYEIHLLRLKGTYLRNDGVFQHYVKYKSKSINVKLPRSRKALIVHWISTLVKLIMIVFVMSWGIHSVLWKLVLGLLLGSVLSVGIHAITATKLRNTYIFTRGFSIKMALWLIIIVLMSNFQVQPFDINVSEMSGAVVAFLLLFDPFIEDGIKLIEKNIFSKPVVKQPAEVSHLLNNNFRFYVSASVWSAVYPVFKWVFG